MLWVIWVWENIKRPRNVARRGTWGVFPLMLMGCMGLLVVIQYAHLIDHHITVTMVVMTMSFS